MCGETLVCTGRWDQSSWEDTRYNLGAEQLPDIISMLPIRFLVEAHVFGGCISKVLMLHHNNPVITTEFTAVHPNDDPELNWYRPELSIPPVNFRNAGVYMSWMESISAKRIEVIRCLDPFHAKSAALQQVAKLQRMRYFGKGTVLFHDVRYENFCYDLTWTEAKMAWNQLFESRCHTNVRQGIQSYNIHI